MTQPDTPDSAPSSSQDELLSIGDLAQQTGIAPDTIRVWERRYGRPVAVRLPSGHRRYTPQDVVWLRRIAELLAQGHRPSKVVRLSEEELDALLAEGQSEPTDSPATLRFLEQVRHSDSPRLERSLLRDAKALGPEAFVQDRVAPLLAALGREWADGRIDVRHEHLASEVIQDVLRRLRGRCKTPRSGPLVVATTLPDELHGLGLQMVALQCALAGVRIHNLGVNTPLEEIAEAVKETEASALAISISLASGGVKTDRLLGTLRRMIPDSVKIIVGGSGARGARRGPHGIEYAGDWASLATWLDDLPRAA